MAAYTLKGFVTRKANSGKDALNAIRDMDSIEAIKFNFENHSDKILHWAMKEDSFEGCNTKFMPELKYPNRISNEIERSFFIQNLFQWISIQSQKARFICTICGRQSIIDTTAVLGRAPSTGSGVCTCCLTMSCVNVLTNDNLMPHNMNDVFSQNITVELAEIFPDLKFSVSTDDVIKGKSIKDLSRPDTLLYVQYGSQYMCSIFLECDPAKTKPPYADIIRDHKVLTNPIELVNNVNCASVMLRYNTTIEHSMHSNTDLYNAIWDLVLILVSALRVFMIEGMVQECDTLKGSLYLNYDLGICIKQGFRLFTSEKWLNNMLISLRQTGEGLDFTSKEFTDSINKKSSLPGIRSSKYILMSIISDFESNPFFLIYQNETPTLAILQEDDGDYTRVVHKDVPLVDMKFLIGSGDPQNGTIDPYTLRLGKMFLFRYLLQLQQEELFESNHRNVYSLQSRANKERKIATDFAELVI